MQDDIFIDLLMYYQGHVHDVVGKILNKYVDTVQGYEFPHLLPYSPQAASL